MIPKITIVTIGKTLSFFAALCVILSNEVIL